LGKIKRRPALDGKNEMLQRTWESPGEFQVGHKTKERKGGGGVPREEKRD